ncbi:DUF547 domain-containing protein [bacterium]
MKNQNILAIVLILFSFSVFCRAEIKIDYSKYRVVLDKFVNSEGMVNYKSLVKERANLDSFMISLKNISYDEFLKSSDNVKIAFWINVYNAATLKAIIDHYPIEEYSRKSFRFPKNSIRQIKGVWTDIEFDVFDGKYTLDQIEHKILRKEFTEPRIHFALVCASISCPVLLTEPYMAETLYEQLDQQVKIFVTTESKVRIVRAKNIIYLSPIFKWFKKDFTNENGVLNFLDKYVPLNDVNNPKIKYLKYDWALNEQS